MVFVFTLFPRSDILGFYERFYILELNIILLPPSECHSFILENIMRHQSMILGSICHMLGRFSSSLETAGVLG